MSVGIGVVGSGFVATMHLAAIAKLGEVGARPLAPLASHSWGEQAAWFADPDGNVVAVAEVSS